MTHTQDSIRHLLATNDRAVERALVVLYDRQEADEKVSDETRHDNNVGFNSADARKLSYYARWVISGRHLDGWHLMEARRRVGKYSRQLLEAAEAKTAAKAAV